MANKWTNCKERALCVSWRKKKTKEKQPERKSKWKCEIKMWIHCCSIIETLKLRREEVKKEKHFQATCILSCLTAAAKFENLKKKCFKI